MESGAELWAVVRRGEENFRGHCGQGGFVGRVGTLAELPGVLRVRWMQGKRRRSIDPGMGMAEEQ